MNKTLIYPNQSRIKTEEDFKDFFLGLNNEQKYNLLYEIFSENISTLSSMFESSYEMSSSDVAFLFLRKLSANIIEEYKTIIERIFISVENSQPIKINILKKICTLTLFKKKGLSISFINSKRLISDDIPVDIKIELSRLLVYLDPKGITFDFDILNYPFLIPAKLLLFENKPFDVLSEFFSIPDKPNEIIIQAIVKRPLKLCLENLLIRDNGINEYVDSLEFLINNHWSKNYVIDIMNSPSFIKNKINHKIEFYRSSKLVLIDSDFITSIYKDFEEVKDFSQVFQISKFSFIVKDESSIEKLIYYAVKDFENYHKANRVYSLYDDRLYKASIVLQFFYDFFKYKAISILKKFNYTIDFIANNSLQLKPLKLSTVSQKVVTDPLNYIKSLNGSKVRDKIQQAVNDE